MEIFYFGSNNSLFGIYYPPEIIQDKKVGIVICNPFGQESIRCHLSMSLLAQLLSKKGFYVLRFDYYGCGDSLGGKKEGTIERWLDDIKTAVEELTHYITNATDASRDFQNLLIDTLVNICS